MKHFDVVIAGGGLSGMICADTLANSPNTELRIAIVDPDPASLKSRTFASWTKKSEPPHRYSGLVSKRWDRFRVTDPRGNPIERSFEDYCYEYVSGESLFEHWNQKINADPRFHRIDQSVRTITEERNPDTGQIRAVVELKDGRILHADRVLSSPARHPGAVQQSFFGLEIETTEEFFDPDVVDLMDFRFEQKGEVRFVYRLPLSKTRALVEFTVFSASDVSRTDCEAGLQEYLSRLLGLPSYSVLRTESGIIPMGVDPEPFFPPSFRSQVMESIGGAGGRIKASTGYSFRRNLEHPEAGTSAGSARFRFRMYDVLLLGMIRQNGGVVAGVFARLFARNRPGAVFSFLDEKSRPLDEARIFWSLPWTPFLRQLLLEYPFLFAAMATLLLQHAIGGFAGWIVPLSGLLITGVPHGSVDHLLNPAQKNRLSFTLRYLIGMALYLLAWWFAPLLTFLFFLWQSADHFGEAYWIRAIRASKNDPLVRGLVWLWGLFAAGFSVLFHWEEAMPIVIGIVGDQEWIRTLPDSRAGFLSLVLFGMAFIAAHLLDRYERRSRGRPPSGAPATLLLGAVLMMLPLLPGFLCFFAFWHGWDSIRAQRERMGWSVGDYVRKALPLSVVSWAGIFGLIWWFDGLIWKVFFIAIGALTAAHVPAMKRFLLSRPTEERG